VKKFAPPIFIFDGPDGTGKTTQALLMGRYLSEGGTRVCYFSFPVYEFPIGQVIGRSLGRWGAEEKIGLPSPEDMAYLYALNRLEALPLLRSAIFLDRVILLNRGPYANLFNVARRILEDKVDWEGLAPEEKARRVGAILAYDREFLDSITEERDLVHVFFHLPTEESMVLSRQRARSTLGGEPDEFESWRELQELTRQMYQEIGEGEIPGHRAEMVRAERGSVRRMWEATRIAQGREERSGVIATAYRVSKIVFPHLGTGPWESVWEYYVEALDAPSGLLLPADESKFNFDFRRRLGLGKGFSPDLFGKRPELWIEVQKRPGVLEAIRASQELDRELHARSPERGR